MSKFRTRRLCLAIGLLLVFCPALRAADDNTVVKSVNGEVLKQILEEEGYKSITVEKPNNELQIVRWKLEGRTVVAYCRLNFGDIQCHFGAAGTNANQRRINQWNESKKFFKAYLDKDGDPIFDHVLVVKYGVTRKSVKEHIALMQPGITAFVKEVCD